jgi:hypothetical protein
MEKLELNLDSIWESEYFYTEFDLGYSGHKIVINENDKENFLDAWASEWRKRAEEYLKNQNMKIEE